ncbi:TIGR02391 family protein [Nocardia sp. NPDC057227]|uniref:TIGR02391 family protein n=1 Tax=Nocardia sp. NPDC057227 TaxID=3346056 RepID=UPI00362A8CF5
MAETYTPQYLRSVLDAVNQFREALYAFAFLHDREMIRPPYGESSVIELVAKEGVSSFQVSSQRRLVNAAAGRASEAVTIADAHIPVRGVSDSMDPITLWRYMMGENPLFTPEEILDCADYVTGRLEALIQRAEGHVQPSMGPTQLHPLVWGAAGKLWGIGEYRRAVAAACDAVEHHGRNITSRFDIDGTPLWDQAFSPAPPQQGKPRLRWPGDAEHKSVKNMNSGLTKFAPGVQMTIRNDATHGQGVSEYSEQEALERLAALSLLTRWVDTCQLEEADEPAAQVLLV